MTLKRSVNFRHPDQSLVGPDWVQQIWTHVHLCCYTYKPGPLLVRIKHVIRI